MNWPPQRDSEADVLSVNRTERNLDDYTSILKISKLRTRYKESTDSIQY